MKKNLLITLGAAACVLVSCNSRMPQISDEEGIKLAGEIHARHNDSSLFTLPNKFHIIDKEKDIEESNTSTGYIKKQRINQEEYSFDLDNLYYKWYHKHKTENQESVEIIYYFYDSEKSIYYEAKNQNGLKTRRDMKMTPKEAKAQLLNVVHPARDIITDNAFLIDFEESIKKDKETHDKFKDETDQYCNYFIGSKDAKSLQLIEESKIKNEFNDLEGFVTFTSENTIENDLLISINEETELDCSNKDGQFYDEHTTSKTTVTNYGICQIEKIIIEDYEKKE